MNAEETHRAEEPRPINKATMDQPQEEFIADPSMPSRPATSADREHGDEVEGAKLRNTDAGHTHSGH